MGECINVGETLKKKIDEKIDLACELDPELEDKIEKEGIGFLRAKYTFWAADACFKFNTGCF